MHVFALEYPGSNKYTHKQCRYDRDPLELVHLILAVLTNLRDAIITFSERHPYGSND